MVRLTVDLIAKSSNHSKTCRSVSLQQYLKKLTHLNFSNKSIEDIVSLKFKCVQILVYNKLNIALPFKSLGSVRILSTIDELN